MRKTHWIRLLYAFVMGAIIGQGLGLATMNAYAQEYSITGNYVYGSGAPAGKLGSPVLSTQPYTAISDWMVAGDSITVRGYKALAAQKPTKRLAVNAWSGRGTTETVDQILSPSVTPVIPPVLIMAVGTNDIFDPFVMSAQVKRLLTGVEARAPGTRVYWVTVQASRPATALADQRNSMAVNQAIWTGCTAELHCKVIDWAMFFAAKPSRLTMYLDKGGVHPIIPTGTNVWGKFIGDAVSV
jgi:hypothetical protein